MKKNASVLGLSRCKEGLPLTKWRKPVREGGAPQSAGQTSSVPYSERPMERGSSEVG